MSKVTVFFSTFLKTVRGENVYKFVLKKVSNTFQRHMVIKFKKA